MLSITRNQIKVCGYILLALVIAPYIKVMFINIHPDEAGVLWKRFDGGTQTNRVYKGGLHIILPFDRMTVYKIHEQQYKHEFNILSKSGLKVGIIMLIRFTPRESTLPQLHKSVGPDYFDRIIAPEVESFMRTILVDHEAEEIYKSKGEIIEKIKPVALEVTMAKYFKLVNFTVLEIILPEQVRKNIEEETRRSPK